MRWLAAILLSVGTPSDPHIPVVGSVIESFRAPACTRCAGRRGVVIATSPQSPVWAVHPGVVSFVGSVARQKYVVFDIAHGVKVTYGWVDDIFVSDGDIVSRGLTVASTGRRMYLGVRVQGRYVEPLGYLRLSSSGLTGPGWVSPIAVRRLFVGRGGFSR